MPRTLQVILLNSFLVPFIFFLNIPFFSGGLGGLHRFRGVPLVVTPLDVTLLSPANNKGYEDTVYSCCLYDHVIALSVIMYGIGSDQ